MEKEKKKKVRLDVLLLDRGLFPSREKARAAIMSGMVYVNGQREDKPGSAFHDDEGLDIEVRGRKLPYVSRGGLKLEKAMEVFDIELSGACCMDIGASTGGFTDCMLQNGAEQVYSVDVGYGQLDWKLRNDPRVVCMEKTNIRYIKPEDIDGRLLDFASCDVSFISLEKVLPAVWPLLREGAYMVCLIKPQFEAGREEVGKHGVVRDIQVHRAVIERIWNFSSELGFSIKGLSFSPIKGPEGNIEYLILLLKDGSKEGMQSPSEAMSKETSERFEKRSEREDGHEGALGCEREEAYPDLSKAELELIEKVTKEAHEALSEKK